MYLHFAGSTASDCSTLFVCVGCVCMARWLSSLSFYPSSLSVLLLFIQAQRPKVASNNSVAAKYLRKTMDTLEKLKAHFRSKSDQRLSERLKKKRIGMNEKRVTE